MGFHCGNTPSCKLCADRAVKYQLIQHRLLEPAGSDPDFTRGTLEGDIAASDITFYRLQCDSEGELRAYIAQGEVLPVKTRSFGGIGVFAIPEMGRFYRHVLVQKRYPHHGAVAFGHYGKLLFEVFKYPGRGRHRLQPAQNAALSHREPLGLRGGKQGMQQIQQAIRGGQTALGIELGSTRIKAVLIGPDHTPIASGDHTWENRLENGVWTYRLQDV